MIDRNETHRPLGARVLVKVDTPELTPKESKIQLLAETLEREAVSTDSGVVVDIGSTAFQGLGDGSPWVKIGDRVTFLRHAGAIRKYNGVDYRVLNDVDLLTAYTINN